MYKKSKVNVLKYFLNNEEQMKLINNIKVKVIPLNAIEDQKLVQNALKVFGIKITNIQIKIQREREINGERKNTTKLNDDETKKKIIQPHESFIKVNVLLLE